MTDGPALAAAAPPRVPRWIAAVLCILYGFAKINGSQFTILESELARPMGEVSGFWLTWYYFGYSGIYGTMLALLQIGAGILLVWPRTALAGALLLLPIVANIVLIDLFYGVDAGGTAAALVLLVCVILTIAPYTARLRNAILLETLPARPSRGSLAAIVVVTLAAWGFTWWVANYNNRAPTAIDGVWSVVERSAAAAGSPAWQTVFFERNRAHMVVFRAGGQPDARHHFEVDENGAVRIWQTWLRKDRLIMEGQSRSADEIELKELERGGRLVLRRRGQPNE